MRFSDFRKKLVKSFTVMIIPHSSSKTVRFHISSSFLVFMFAVWTALTLWAGYITSKNIDYWRMKMGNQMLKLKVEFFAKELKDTREMLDQIHQVDGELRTLLGMKSKDKIIKTDALGGPTATDSEDLNKALTDRMAELSKEDIERQINVTKTETNERVKSYVEIQKYIDHERSLYRAKPNMWPTTEGHITSAFGWRLSPFNKTASEFHSAVDIGLKTGTPVYATADGVVRLSGWEGGYGKIVVLDHKHGYSTRYAHLSELMAASGAKVKRGQVIGLSGSTGISTGPHLHYEVWHDNKPVNPYYYMSSNKNAR